MGNVAKDRARRSGFGGFGGGGVATTLLVGDGLDRAWRTSPPVRPARGQHAERLLEGRQRGQHFDVRRPYCWPFDDDELRLQLVVALGEIP